MDWHYVPISAPIPYHMWLFHIETNSGVDISGGLDLPAAAKIKSGHANVRCNPFSMVTQSRNLNQSRERTLICSTASGIFRTSIYPFANLVNFSS